MFDELHSSLAAHGQEHLLAFWNQLDDEQRKELAGQVQAIDLATIDRLYQHRNEEGDIRALADRAEAPPAFRLDTSANRFTADEARQRGDKALAAGEVGAILVAGGQGTRLGFDYPKGMFPIGPVSGKTLFQIHVEKIVALGRRHGVRIPLYLMTSPATHGETVRFFEENNRFGLAEDDLTIFCQGTMPAVDEASGKILLDSPGRIATSPDGHGGMLAALQGSGALGHAEQRGISHLFYFQVDNPLIDIGSAELLGYHLLSESELTTQVIAKRQPLERVGNVVRVGDEVMVIEYSDLPDDIAQRRNEDGSLTIWAGSIAVHLMETAMLRRLLDTSEGLPFHVARKKVPFVDPSGGRVEPEAPNAIKFERFIFDVMPSARNAIVVEVDPAEGFAPLKNASGAPDDTPEDVKSRIVAQHTRWLRAAGADVTEGVEVEVGPLWALDEREVSQKVSPGTRIAEPTYLG